MLAMQVAHSWRTTKDISLGDDPAVGWSELLENLDNSARLARYAGPGGWNDLGAPHLCPVSDTCFTSAVSVEQAAGEPGRYGAPGAICRPGGVE